MNGWVFVDTEGRDFGGYVKEAKVRVAEEIKLPPRYSITWSGKYEYRERAAERLRVVVPLTLAIIVVLLYLNFRNLMEVAILLASLPFALIGGIWPLYLLEYNLSVANGVDCPRWGCGRDRGLACRYARDAFRPSCPRNALA